MSPQDHSKVILGIDPGSKIAGFGCLRFRSHITDLRKGVEFVDAGILRLSASAQLHARVHALFTAVEQLITEFKPDVCVLEKAFIGPNPQSALRLGEIRGAVIAACGRRSLPIIEMTPAAIKKTVTGTGRATKENISTCLETLLNFNRGKLPFDATDALAMAFACGLELPWRNLSAQVNGKISTENK